MVEAEALPPSPFDWLPRTIWQESVVRELAAGETLFRQGDSARAVFAVESGRLRLLRRTVEGHTVVIHTARKGELFAEAALFSPTYHCDAIATVRSHVREFSKRGFLSAIRSDAKLAERFMAVLAHQLQTIRTRLEQRNIRSARERVLHHLALAAGPDRRTVQLTGTLMELAEEIGLTHEALYRTLAALEKQRAIERTGSRIVLRKLPAI